MKYKLVISLFLLIAGMFLIIFSVHSMNKISSSKAEVGGIASAISGNPVGIIVGESLKGRASQYDTSVLVCLYSGIALAVVGGALTILYIKNRL